MLSPKIIHTSSPGRRQNQFVQSEKTIKTRKIHLENLQKQKSATVRNLAIKNNEVMHKTIAENKASKNIYA